MDEGSKKRILFVDDDKHLLNGLRRMLRKMKDRWDMDFANGGQEALDALRLNKYDVIVSDMLMPGISGVRLLEHVRERYPGTIRFMLTGCSKEPLNEHAIMCAHQMVAKPCDTDELINMIEHSLSLHDGIKSHKAAQVMAQMRSIPSMPRIYQRVIKTLRKPHCSLRRVGRIIAEDIGMSSKMLQVANSAFYGKSGHIADPTRAVVHLGLRTVEALVLTHGVFSTLTEEQMKDFWVDGIHEHCVRVGLLTKKICKLEGMSEEELELASMAGILHDAGLMILVSEFPEEYRRAIELSRSEHISIYESECEEIKMTHAELGGCLLDLWGLPNAIIEAAAMHHDPGLSEGRGFSILAAVYAADVIDHELCSSPGGGWVKGADMEYIEKMGLSEKLQQWRKLHLPTGDRELEYV
ncbi:Hydrogenase transcriptional regulatory protein hupR1 [Anaerohalosphaera lusitana]|uniref:Hydrogenase transcriptional regulatory protein hupR1 n=1 Tax=Anaerohalosphaera lusitana TaxID=1936003 RepID=A0A1U9NMF0_9BACT|nr:response regulator [Anaerohalosphaera lusitana]AQT68686.1 Hydrogenase transcriptional regulatory protein hupR1 [Anaerohalosphaera lusitana]